MGPNLLKYLKVALSVAGSAILLFSCEESEWGAATANNDKLMNEYSENLSIVMSQNGRRSYHFVTPLLEGYMLGSEPYREFRKGVKITTYKDDSLSSVDAVLTANYAIYYDKRELWEAKGNVVVEKSDGKTLYTQQLFWNARTGKIYSNVDSKIVQSGGRDVFIGEGFESDEEFKDWRFRRMKGQMEVDATPRQPADSAGRASRDTVERRPRATRSEPAARPVQPAASVPAPRPAAPAVRRDKEPTAPTAAVPSLQGAAESTVEAERKSDMRNAERLELAAPATLGMEPAREPDSK